MIVVTDLYKTFGRDNEIKALSNINLNVSTGDLYGLIGPDGAGKTTLIRILTTLLLPNKGSVRVAGYDVKSQFKELRKILGYMPGRFSLYQDLTVEENLNFYANIFNTTIELNYHLIKDIFIQLEPFRKRRAGALSGGMKQKLALCCALIHKPKVLFLDEPTTGVDVVSRKEFWEMLRVLKNEGITIFVSTPYMDEASLCDKLALIQGGCILSENTPAKMIKEFDFKLFAGKTQAMHSAQMFLASIKSLNDVYIFGEYLHIKSDNPDINKEFLFSSLKSKGYEDIEVKEIGASIEDCFMALMKTSLKSPQLQ